MRRRRIFYTRKTFLPGTVGRLAGRAQEEAIEERHQDKGDAQDADDRRTDGEIDLRGDEQTDDAAEGRNHPTDGKPNDDRIGNVRGAHGGNDEVGKYEQHAADVNEAGDN